MNVKSLSQLFSFRDLRNAIVGAVVILGGLGLSGVTLWAHQTGNVQLAGIAAGVSLVFVLLILIFVVPPLARNAGREASQMNLPFEFTTGGAIMLVLIVIVAFSAWNTGNNLLFLVLSFLIAAMLVGFFAGSISLKKLDVTMRFPDTIFAGEPTPIRVAVQNRKRLFPAISVVVDVRGKERERSIAARELDSLLPQWLARRLGRAPLLTRTLDHFVHVRSGEKAEATTQQMFPNRGRLSIRDFELSTKFPFGFFRHRRRLPARAAELIVFPRAVDVEDAVDDLPFDLGKRVSGKRGLSHDLLSLRDYQPQDDLRRIDWKATARSRQLTVREYAAEDERRLTVIFDPHIPVDDEPAMKLREKLALEQKGRSVVVSERFEAGAAIAASLLMRFSAENGEFSLVIGDEVDEFGSGHAHLYDCLKHLSNTEPLFEPEPTGLEPETRLARILNEAPDSHHVLVTANAGAGLSDDVLQRLKIIGF